VQTITTIAELRLAVRRARAAGATVGLVPTMGALHAGHLALVDAARARAGVVIMSVFVNPLQFGPAEDFAAYPRDLDRDAAAARAKGVDILFVPSEREMYARKPVVAVTPTPGGPADVPLDAHWEGAARPGHFSGVLTVVAKLFNIATPDVAVFGRKDLQQATLVRAMVRDLDWPIEIVVVPTVRAADGLALSSRNAYLSSEDRERALAIPRALDAMVRAWCDEGVADAERVVAIGRRVLGATPGLAVDYIGIAEPDRLAPTAAVREGAVGLIAARVGRTRLIDNAIFARPGEDR
jgi:pantoate--beta-alanine ligase